MPEMNKILCNAPQNLSEQQKKQASDNIGASSIGSLNLNDYDYVDLTDNLVFEPGFSRRGSVDEYVRYFPVLGLLAINLCIFKSTEITSANWTPVASLTDDRFYFSDYTDTSNMPIGVLGMNSGAVIASGITYNPPNTGTNKNLVYSNFITTGYLAYKDVVMQEANYGVFFSRSFAVVNKPSV